MIVNRIMSVALVAAVAGCLGLSGWVWSQSRTIDRLRVENSVLGLSLGGCNARLENIRKDKESDAQIDSMPDLHDVPPGWLMPAPGAGGVD